MHLAKIWNIIMKRILESSDCESNLSTYARYIDKSHALWGIHTIFIETDSHLFCFYLD